MREELNLVTPLHTRSKRDYLARVNSADKAECSTIARQFGRDYWDGDRKYGYGGYKYDGRWSAVAKGLVERYRLTNASRVLDVGCGKGFLMHEIRTLVPGIDVRGIDISQYAIDNAKEEVREFVSVANAKKLPFADRSFDLVVSLGTLHNLYLFDLVAAIREIVRVSKGDGFVMVESYRNEREKMNLLYWQLTCEAFLTPDEWRWLYDQNGYQGDYEFIYFE